MDLALLVFLILFNGLFAASEMALTAARRARLAALADEGDRGASAALAMHDQPTRWLSTVQIGITSISVLNGIVGDAAFSEPLAALLEAALGAKPRVAHVAATGLVVAIVTFLTIIFGELVPKRLGQLSPEAAARVLARPMLWLSAAARPFVWLLSASTEATLRLLGVRGTPVRSVTEAEIAASLEEGVDAGVIEAGEHRLVRNVFRLDDRQVGSMMIPRAEITWLDLERPPSELLAQMAREGRSRYPVCRGGLDDVVGVLDTRSLLEPLARGEQPAIDALMLPAVFVPETLTGMELLEHFRTDAGELVFVVDEYGAVQGVITVRDVLEAIAGEFSAPTDDEAWAIRRGDGSWLFDGLIPIPELKDRLGLRTLPEEGRGRYNTLAGMIMLLAGRLPRTADVVQWEAWRFEVVDLDGKRVDKVLASPAEPIAENPSS